MPLAFGETLEGLRLGVRNTDLSRAFHRAARFGTRSYFNQAVERW